MTMRTRRGEWKTYQTMQAKLEEGERHRKERAKAKEVKQDQKEVAIIVGARTTPENAHRKVQGRTTGIQHKDSGLDGILDSDRCNGETCAQGLNKDGKDRGHRKEKGKA